MSKPLKNKHAIITGGGTGIGAAIATQLAGSGANITVMGRRLEPITELAKHLANTQAISVDVSNEQSVSTAFEQAGDYDILVNNAGFATSAPAHHTSLSLWQSTIDVNLTGVFLCSTHAINTLRKKNYGRIITVASTAGLTGYRYVSAYCAAKHGVVGYTKALALELANTGTTVNAVCPGYTETEMLAQTIDNIMSKTECSETQAREQLLSGNPQRRFVQPAEVANLVLTLCLDESRSITGQAIAIDGGETI